MEAEELIEIFDRRWFESYIYDTRERKRPNSVELVPDSGGGKHGDNNLSVVHSRDPKVLVRPMGDRLASLGRFSPMGSASPDTILPSWLGKEPGIEEEEGTADTKKERRRLVRREAGTMSKSMSELEFEEVKGFMDLGFVFSEADKDTSLAEIIPGLHRLGKRDAEEEGEVEEQRTSKAVPWPYLLESWEWWERGTKGEAYLQRLASMHWEVPVSGDLSDIKRSLRMWAHNVASVVHDVQTEKLDFF